MEAEVQCGLRDVPVFGEAMHHAAGFAGLFLAHDAQRVFAGCAGVDDQRLAAFTGGADVGAEALLLPGHVAGGAEVVEAGLADGNDPVGAAEFHQLRHSRFLHVGAVRMHADRRAQLLIRLRQSDDPRPVLQRYADAKGVFHPCRRHVGEDLGQAFGQFGEIEMAV